MTLQSPERDSFVQELELELESDNLLKLSELSKRISTEIKNPLKAVQYKRLILEKTNKISNIITM
ncbi:hypothetical protein M0P65_04930 [Candidatus Gracilibacteria bacterium]|jgi:hypothetical protein|nr:hypothetical protein [Candidatus Gracilibacteria bacterium]